MFKVQVVYQDEYLMVLEKPAGLVVDPSDTHAGGTLVDWLKEYYDAKKHRSVENLDRMGVVHRLDKDTSGLLLVAKTKEVLENLQSQFKKRTVKKEYLALVHGLVEKKGKVEGSIGRNPGNREKFMVISPGKGQSPPSRWPNGLLEGERWAETGYEPIKRLAFSVERLAEIFPDYSKLQMRKLDNRRYSSYTLIYCYPKTGRTHQIRVHLKYIGHPVVSDSKYGGRKTFRLDKRWCKRMFLHAKRIEFQHPMSGKIMVFESKLPDDLEEALDNLAAK